MKVRRRTLNLTVLALAFMLTISFFAVVVPAKSQDTATIISELEILRGMVMDEKLALKNKINAVIHQIEAGAFTGAVNKLENDVKKSIKAWVEDTEKRKALLYLVDEIIVLIKGIIHYFEITANPDYLEIVQGGWGISIINVTSQNGFSRRVELSARLTPHTEKVVLILEPAWVVPTPEGKISTLNVMVAIDAEPGEYDITVTGTSRFLERSVKIKLIIKALVEDTTAPTIVSVLRSPETPAYNESVTVTAFVFDVGSGVKQVILNYSDGIDWTPVEMTLSEGLYKADIPAFPYEITVEYRVYASDYADNRAPPSTLYSYKVIDPYPPLLRIDSPAHGSYLSGTVAITVFMKDQNSGGESGFAEAKLFINDVEVKIWEPPVPPEPTTYDWNTAAFGPDGVYIVKLRVRDKAGNVVEKSLAVVVDNTLPSAVIDAPVDGSYLRLSVLIKVTGSDANFDKMEVRIDDELVRTSTTSGSEVLEWNTRNYDDGVHSVTLTVYDKAGNIKRALVNVTVDNTPPSIGTPSWSPKEPAANVNIQINVTVTEPTYGSGVENVTLWFMNKTLEDWQPIPMQQLNNGNWTATLSNQSDTDVRFYIEAFDRAGNRDKSPRLKFHVAAPPGVPLAWILAAIAIIGGSSGGAAYYVRRRRKKGMTGASVSAVPSVASV